MDQSSCRTLSAFLPNIWCEEKHLNASTILLAMCFIEKTGSRTLLLAAWYCHISTSLRTWTDSTSVAGERDQNRAKPPRTATHQALALDPTRNPASLFFVEDAEGNAVADGVDLAPVLDVAAAVVSTALTKTYISPVESELMKMRP